MKMLSVLEGLLKIVISFYFRCADGSLLVKKVYKTKTKSSDYWSVICS